MSTLNLPVPSGSATLNYKPHNLVLHLLCAFTQSKWTWMAPGPGWQCSPWVPGHSLTCALNATGYPHCTCLLDSLFYSPFQVLHTFPSLLRFLTPSTFTLSWPSFLFHQENQKLEKNFQKHLPHRHLLQTVLELSRSPSRPAAQEITSCLTYLRTSCQ